MVKLNRDRLLFYQKLGLLSKLKTRNYYHFYYVNRKFNFCLFLKSYDFYVKFIYKKGIFTYNKEIKKHQLKSKIKIDFGITDCIRIVDEILSRRRDHKVDFLYDSIFNNILIIL